MLAHVQILEVHPPAAQVGGVVLEVQREAGRLVADEREDYLRRGV